MLPTLMLTSFTESQKMPCSRALSLQAGSRQHIAAAKRYILAIAQCYSLVAVLFVMRNTLQGLGFTYANSIAGMGEFFGRLSIAFLLTPALGFDAVCYAGPAAWLLADIPLAVIYFAKAKKFRRITSNQKDAEINVQKSRKC